MRRVPAIVVAVLAIGTTGITAACGGGSKPAGNPCDQSPASGTLHERVIKYEGQLTSYTFDGPTKSPTLTNDPSSIPFDPSKTNPTPGGSVHWSYGPGIKPLGGQAVFQFATGPKTVPVGAKARSLSIPAGETQFYVQVCGFSPKAS
jgi:hypothetical protein